MIEPEKIVENKENEESIWQSFSVEDSATLLSKVSFSWVLPFLYRAIRKGEELNFDDLDDLSKIEQPQQYLEKVKQSILQNDGEEPKGSLRQGLMELIGKDICCSMFLTNMAVTLGFIQPFLISIIVQSTTAQSASERVNGTTVTNYEHSLSAGLSASFGMAIVGFSSEALAQTAWHIGGRCARESYAVVSSLIFVKPALVTSKEIHKFSEGEIVNLMATDCQTVLQVVTLFNLFSVLPAIVFGSLSLLFYALGWPVLVLFGFLTLNTLLVDFVSKRVTRLQDEKNSLSDQRSIRMNESLQGIQTIKLNTWERFTKDRISHFRERESVQLRYIAGLRSLQFFMSNAIPLLGMIGTFLLRRYAISEDLTVETVFFSIPLFIQLSSGLVLVPSMLNEYRRYRVSVDRLESFLILKENDEKNSGSNDGSVVFENVTLSWADTGENHQGDLVAINMESPRGRPCLTDISLSIESGELIAVVGPVASGKSTLLNAMLKLIIPSSGKVTVNGSTAYVAQRPFVMNATVRENICFGEPFDLKKYNRVIRVCSLKADIESFSNGDLTEVGEKGITLSGGQKQRIGLARAAYSEKSIVLLDGCLSAMDADVGSRCFEACILELLKGRTRVIVTNHLNFAEKCDRTIVVEESGIAEVGTWEQLKKNNSSTLYKMAQQHFGDNYSADEMFPQYTLFSKDIEGLNKDISVECLSNNNKDTGLVQKEEKIKGRIGIRDFVAMSRAAETTNLFYVVCLFLFLVPFLQYMVVFYIGEWAGEGTPASWNAVAPILVIGVLFSLSVALLSLLINVYFVRSANRIHDSMLASVFSCPSWWFDTIPLGRILQRFTGDIMSIDILLPRQMEIWFDNFGQVLMGTIPAAILLPPFLLIACPVLLVFYKCYKYYGEITLQCQRLALISSGPILSSFSTFLQGLDTIRAFDKVKYFVDTFYSNNRKFCQAMYSQSNTDRFFIIRLTGCVISVFVFALGAFLVSMRGTKLVTPEITGLLLAYVVSLNFRVFALFFSTAQIERLMASSQRCLEFMHLPSELENSKKRLKYIEKKKTSWPNSGDIVFNSVKLSYRDGLPLVLKGVSFGIESGQKVALVGRSGSGKTSIMLALFRLVEICGGQIKIAGHDIKTIERHTLRSRIGMIPQDPWVFAGTIRQNLDSNGEYSDEALWKVLGLVHLKKMVQAFTDQLNHGIDENAENLSAGTVQLICLARVLLKQPKIIVMDEATSCVDLVTDSIVQKAIRSSFAHSTLLAIAHRLHTIIDFDKIVAVQDGTIAEVGTPTELLTKGDDGVFASLVRATGEKSAQELILRARKKATNVQSIY